MDGSSYLMSVKFVLFVSSCCSKYLFLMLLQLVDSLTDIVTSATEEEEVVVVVMVLYGFVLKYLNHSLSIFFKRQKKKR